MHYVTKYRLFGVFPIKNPGKTFMANSFALRCRECDSRLQVHLRSSNTPVSLFVHVCLLGVAGAWSVINIGV